jgi:hypothetical protein
MAVTYLLRRVQNNREVGKQASDRRDVMLKMLAAQVAVVLIVSVGGTANAASVIYDGGSPAQGGAILADSRTEDTQAAPLVSTYGDAFMVDGIDWWGVYSNFSAGGSTAPAPTDAFTLNIYKYQSGDPGALVDSISLGGGNRTATGKTVRLPAGPAANEYAYSASFAGVNLAPGYYYFALGDTTASGGNWALEFNSSEGGPGIGGASYDQGLGIWSPTFATNFPIQIMGVATTPVVPIPAALWLMISGLGGLGALGSRARSAGPFLIRQ